MKIGAVRFGSNLKIFAKSFPDSSKIDPKIEENQPRNGRNFMKILPWGWSWSRSGTLLAPKWLWMRSGLPLELDLGGSRNPSWRQDGPGWRQDGAMLADLAPKIANLAPFLNAFWSIFGILGAKSQLAKNPQKPTVFNRFFKISGMVWSYLGAVLDDLNQNFRYLGQS